MTITIELATDNDAFTDDRDAETGRIVTAIARQIKAGALDERGNGWNLIDANGNTVGSVTITGR